MVNPDPNFDAVAVDAQLNGTICSYPNRQSI